MDNLINFVFFFSLIHVNHIVILPYEHIKNLFILLHGDKHFSYIFCFFIFDEINFTFSKHLYIISMLLPSNYGEK